MIINLPPFSSPITATFVLWAGLNYIGDAMAQPAEIQVIDEASGRGVPLVELTTVNHLRFITDNAGRVAFDEPGLMGNPVFFHIKSHGYEFPTDGFGYQGKSNGSTSPNASTESRDLDCIATV